MLQRDGIQLRCGLIGELVPALSGVAPSDFPLFGAHDFVPTPNGTRHEHGNASEREDACLFSFIDLPVMQSLGLHREETFGDTGGGQPIEATKIAPALAGGG